MKKITDPAFKYDPACDTDIRRLFKRVRMEVAKSKAEADAKSRARIAPLVTPIKRAAK